MQELRRRSLRRARIVQPYIILDVEVRAPVTDFRRSLELGDLQHRQFVFVVNSDTLLRARDKLLVR